MLRHGGGEEEASTRYLVLGTKYQVLGTKYQVLGTKYQVLGTKYQVLGTKYQVLGTFSVSVFLFIFWWISGSSRGGQVMLGSLREFGREGCVCGHFPTPGGGEEEGGGRGSQTPADPKGSADSIVCM